MIRYWFGSIFGAIRPKPHWTVTWPTSPDGIYTIPVRRAAGIKDAILQARAVDAPTNPGYTIGYDWEPEVWQVKPGPPHRVSGPDYEAITPHANTRIR